MILAARRAVARSIDFLNARTMEGPRNDILRQGPDPRDRRERGNRGRDGPASRRKGRASRGRRTQRGDG